MIEASVSNFTGPYARLNGNGQKLSISKLMLARCVMTVGQAGLQSTIGLGFWRLQFLLSLTMAHVKNDKGRLALSDVFYRLDSTECRAVSYHLGMGLANAASQIMLQTRWLQHLSLIPGAKLSQSGNRLPPKLQKYASKIPAREPDLIGFDHQNRPHVVEAKGYSSGLNTREIQHAIDQVSQVVSINGVPPETRVVEYFDLSGAPFLGEIIDPEGDEQGGTSLRLDMTNYLQSYYTSFLRDPEWLGADVRSFRGTQYRVRPIGGFGLAFGIETRVMDEFKNKLELSSFFDLMTEISNRVESQSSTEAVTIGLDGTILFDQNAP